MKIALITGVTGQDGAYLAQFLLQKNYRVVGVLRSSRDTSSKGLSYLKIEDAIIYEACELTDLSQVLSIIDKHKPDEIYNLAAQSSVSLSFQQPIGTIQFNIVSVLNILESIRILQLKTRFYQASSSEIFGETTLPINEKTVLNPLSPYAISKATGHLITKNYRKAYGIYSCSGILFNHESYLRGNNFFVKKVIRDSIKIRNGELKALTVGNIDIKRDFGWAKRYVEAMYLMLQQDEAEDYVICSNKSVSLREIIYSVFNYLGVPHDKLKIDKKLFRPTEIPDIYGNNKKAQEQLNWHYDMSFQDVLKILIDEELQNWNSKD